MTLSKSLYTRAIQCPKSLWLKKYKPEVLTPPDASTKARFETGNDVGDLACELFPNGREIPFDAHDFKSMVRLTQAYLDEGVENIYEATFIFDGIQNGGDAMNTFASLHVKRLDEQMKVREQLLKYSELDTLAMVRVLRKLKQTNKIKP